MNFWDLPEEMFGERISDYVASLFKKPLTTNESAANLQKYEQQEEVKGTNQEA